MLSSPNQKFPQALFFDMDGLSVNSEVLWFEAEQRVAQAFGIDWTEDDHHFCVGGPVEEMARYLAAKAGRESNWSQVARDVVDQVVSLIGEDLALMPGVSALLEECKGAGLPIALVSGSPRIIVDRIVDQIGRSRYGAIVSSDDVVHSKPAADPYIKAAGILGVDIRASVVLEDSATGVESAESAGAFVIMVPEAGDFESNARRIVLTSLEGITLEKIRAFWGN
jgi:HAD superfamily hydrolase (TIGR01509 family)